MLSFIAPGVSLSRSPVPRPSLLTGLIAYWRMEEVSLQRQDVAGLNLLADNNTVTQQTGRVGNCGQFTAANNEYLSIADNAALSRGTSDFTWVYWVYHDTKAASQVHLHKGTDLGVNYEYASLYFQTNDRFRFAVANNVVAAAFNANTFGAPSVSTWYNLAFWYDSAAQTVNASVNNGATDSLAWTGGGYDSAADFNMGRAVSNTLPMNGRMDEVGFWKRVLSPSERAFLYNGGSGRSYPFMP